MIRYEIEKLLISGELEVDDLPDKWDDMYEQYLGVRAEDIIWRPPRHSLVDGGDWLLPYLHPR